MATTNHPIVLIGFMGSGKSSLARRLAHDLHREAIDLDGVIEKNAGCSIAELFRSQGEAHFREMETAALRDVLGTDDVVATGGGIVGLETNRGLLNQLVAGGGTVVYLRAAPDTLAQRIRRHPGTRPLIDGDRALGMSETIERVTQLLGQRGPLYEGCANIVIDTDCLSPAELAHELANRLDLP